MKADPLWAYKLTKTCYLILIQNRGREWGHQTSFKLYIRQFHGDIYSSVNFCLNRWGSHYIFLFCIWCLLLSPSNDARCLIVSSQATQNIGAEGGDTKQRSNCRYSNFMGMSTQSSVTFCFNRWASHCVFFFFFVFGTIFSRHQRRTLPRREQSSYSKYRGGGGTSNSDQTVNTVIWWGCLLERNLLPPSLGVEFHFCFLRFFVFFCHDTMNSASSCALKLTKIWGRGRETPFSVQTVHPVLSWGYIFDLVPQSLGVKRSFCFQLCLFLSSCKDERCSVVSSQVNKIKGPGGGGTSNSFHTVFTVI